MRSVCAPTSQHLKCVVLISEKRHWRQGRCEVLRRRELRAMSVRKLIYELVAHPLLIHNLISHSCATMKSQHE